MNKLCRRRAAWKGDNDSFVLNSLPIYLFTFYKAHKMAVGEI